MIRTLETIVSSIVMYNVTFVNKTIEKTVDKGAIATSTPIGGLLSIALASCELSGGCPFGSDRER
jgi:hypothetical protein